MSFWIITEADRNVTTLLMSLKYQHCASEWLSPRRLRFHAKKLEHYCRRTRRVTWGHAPM